ncbi:Hypothetical protein (Fragment), partial [Durusdinium trenchii]
YYEIAYHDSTQPRRWPIRDLFSLNVGFGRGVNAVCDLEFNLTDHPGVFLGHWSGHSIFNPNLTDIHNTVVDVGVAANGTYNWTLEFQCKHLS